MLVENAELERLIVETHSTVAMLVERSTGIEDKLTGVQRRVDKINGSIAAVQGDMGLMQKEQAMQDGALGALKWLITILISMTGVGAAVAGVVLALVAK